MARIVFVTEFFPESSRAEITGGVEAYCYYVSQELARNHQVEVVANRTDGSEWDTANLRSILRRLAFVVRSFTKVLRCNADVVVGTNYTTYLPAWLAARIRRLPVVFWYPDVLIGQWRNGSFGAGGVVFEALERLVLRLPVDRYVAISEETASKLRAHGVTPDLIAVVPCGADPAVVDEARAATETVPGRVVVVSRLVPYKRVDLVIRAVAVVRPVHPDLRLMVVGQGPERANLERLAEDLGVADIVDFLGHVPSHSDVLTLIASAEVYVTASLTEGFGISVVEAMMAGVPYAASDLDVIREVTGGGVGGRLFEPGSQEALVAELDSLLGDELDRRRLTTEGRQWAERYSWASVARSTESILFDAIAQGGPGSPCQ